MGEGKNKMKTWLKGGLIGAGIAIVLIIFLNPSAKIIGEYAIGISIILGFPWSIILGYVFASSAPSVSNASFAFAFEMGGFIGLILNGFIIGAIIGKIKSVRSEKKQKRKK